MRTFEKIHSIVSRIPAGKVATYGQIAKLAGISNPRVVGFALHINRDPISVPCHRVVNRSGFLSKGYAMGGAKSQRKRLEKEGIRVLADDKVDLDIYLWKT